MKTRCRACDQKNRAEATYCERCGSSLSEPPPAAPSCDGCGARLRMGARYCDSCGAPMYTPGEEEIRSELAAQGVDASADPNASIHAVTVAVRISLPDLRSYAGSDGLISLIFTDMGGFAGVVESLGTTRASAALNKHNKIVREVVENFDGFEVQSELDGFLVAFGDPAEAFECALAIRRTIEDHNIRHPELVVPYRAGIHTTEAVVEDDAYYMEQIAIAAALACSAEIRELLASPQARDLMPETVPIETGEPREIRDGEVPSLAEGIPVLG